MGLQFPVTVDAATDCLGQFLSKDLRHHDGSGQKPAGTPITDLAHELEIRLEQAARTPANQKVDINIDDLWRQMENIQRSFTPILMEHLRTVGEQRGKIQLTIHRVERSWSELAGKPIRFIERLLGRDV